jgi:hypothetical protein
MCHKYIYILTHIQKPQNRGKKKTNAGKDAEKRNPYMLLMGMQIRPATMENSVEVPQKTPKN